MNPKMLSFATTGGGYDCHCPLLAKLGDPTWIRVEWYRTKGRRMYASNHCWMHRCAWVKNKDWPNYCAEVLES